MGLRRLSILKDLAQSLLPFFVEGFELGGFQRKSLQPGTSILPGKPSIRQPQERIV